jgi:hypothetical protein
LAAIAEGFGELEIENDYVAQRELGNKLEDAVRLLQGGAPVYFRGWCAPALAACFEHTFFGGRSGFNDPIWYLGGIGKQPLSPLHRDPTYNFVHQVFGQKRLVLYRPKDCGFFGLQECYDYAQFTWRKWSPGAVPGAPPPIEIILMPGEMLYIPPGWLHCTYARGSNSMGIAWSARCEVVQEHVFR